MSLTKENEIARVLAAIGGTLNLIQTNLLQIQRSVEEIAQELKRMMREKHTF